jgi:hypothetical protein
VSQFELVETSLTSLWDFGWFDRSVFRITAIQGGGPPEAVLSEFLRSPISRRSFCESPDPWGAELDRHGPLLASGLPHVTHQRISHEQLTDEVCAVLKDPQFDLPSSAAQEDAVGAWLASVRTDECFALRRSGDGQGEVDWNHVWLVFREFVCLAPDHRSMTVAVIGYD